MIIIGLLNDMIDTVSPLIKNQQRFSFYPEQKSKFLHGCRRPHTTSKTTDHPPTIPNLISYYCFFHSVSSSHTSHFTVPQEGKKTQVLSLLFAWKDFFCNLYSLFHHFFPFQVLAQGDLLCPSYLNGNTHLLHTLLTCFTTLCFSF